MEKMKMQTTDIANENFLKLAALFPNAVTETIDENGEVVRAIDKDILMQEISTRVIEGNEERYQFTWPDKRQAMRLASTPIAATLRPCREESVNFDTTQNLYIEGDNLDVLKLLRETYLGKVKMIYIDPPYNTGHDFVYNDDFSETQEEYAARSSQNDDQGNRLVQNTESNGRFHTDWLNMIYPRLKVAKDLLADDGVIFISIDDNEVANLKKVCDDIFGEKNFISELKWRGRGGRQDSKYFAVIHESIICYARKLSHYKAGEEIKEEGVYPKFDEKKQRYYKTQLLRKWGSNSLRENRPNLYYPITAPDGSEVYPTIFEENSQVAGVSTPATCNEIAGCWRWGASNMSNQIAQGNVEFLKNKFGKWVPYEKIYAPTEDELPTKKFTTWIDYISNGTQEIKDLFDKPVFDYPKSSELIAHFLKMGYIPDEAIVLDFFSGSATTAHAVMQLNAEDGGKRKFIMVQLPEVCEEKSEAAKAGYKNICEIGKERIRRAGKKIKEEAGLTAADLDIGFRVMKLDSSNMEDVYYSPDKTSQDDLLSLISNIKPDRTPEDLLFQVMLEFGITLDSKIEETVISGKKVFKVAGSFLIACFDENVTDDVVKAIAQATPSYAVLRDSSFANDSVAANFEQIFATYSPDTVRRVL